MTVCRLIHPLRMTTRPSKQSCWDRPTIAGTVQLVNGLLGSNLPIHGTGTGKEWRTGVVSKHDKNGSVFRCLSKYMPRWPRLVELWWNFYCLASIWTALVDTFDTKGFDQISGSSNRQLIPTPERPDLHSDEDWALAPSLFHLQSINACLLCSFPTLQTKSPRSHSSLEIWTGRLNCSGGPNISIWRLNYSGGGKCQTRSSFIWTCHGFSELSMRACIAAQLSNMYANFGWY